MRRHPPTVPAPAQPPQWESKSARKRVAEGAQHLGQELLDVPPSALEGFDLDEELLEAIADAKRNKGQKAYRRSMQHVGALMRAVDLNAVRARFQEWKDGNTRLNARLEQVRIWRDGLVAGEPEMLEEVLAAVPTLDRAEVEELAAQAQTERDNGKSPKAFRALFALIRQSWTGP